MTTSFLIASLGLLVSFSAAASQGPPAFKRVVDDPKLGLLRTELAVSEYDCSYPRDFRLTLYPMIHVGELEYYATAQRRLNQHDIVFFESPRPPGFFARVFDSVGPFPALSERELAKLRLRSLRFFLDDFFSKNGRPAANLVEALGRERSYLKDYLVDDEGAPFVVADQGALGLEIRFSSSPKICSKDLPPPEPITGLVDGLRLAYRLGAEAGGLVAQHDVMTSSLANFKNADISYDLILSGEASWWELRNSYAVSVMFEHLTKEPRGSVAIQYGVGHLQEFHKLLTAKNDCKLKQQEWLPVYRADKGMNLPATQLEKRREMIQQDKNNI